MWHFRSSTTWRTPTTWSHNVHTEVCLRSFGFAGLVLYEPEGYFHAESNHGSNQLDHKVVKDGAYCLCKFCFVSQVPSSRRTLVRRHGLDCIPCVRCSAGKPETSNTWCLFGMALGLRFGVSDFELAVGLESLWCVASRFPGWIHGCSRPTGLEDRSELHLPGELGN